MMSPTRYPRIRQRVKGLGLVQLSTDASNRREHDRRVVYFGELVEAGQLQVIRALMNGTLSWNELVDHRREKGDFGAGVLKDIKLRRSLSDAVASVLPPKGQSIVIDGVVQPQMGKGENGRKRYRVTWKRLHQLRPTITVAELEHLDWDALRAEWGNSPSDWNHLGRFLSAFLTKYVGKRHALRDTLLEKFPRRRETGRIPDLTPAIFWKIVDLAPLHAQASYVALLLTGMRAITEYLACGREHLRPATFQVQIPSEVKTDASVDVVQVDAEDWHWIEAAVPARLRYKWLRKYWCRACVAAGAATFEEPEHERGYAGPTLHSLRHSLAQWATDAGVGIADVKAQLRHSNIATTEAYARRSGARQVSSAISTLMRREKTAS